MAHPVRPPAAGVEVGDADLHCVVVLPANTGMRISELAMLAWDDVDFDDKWIHVRSKITPEGRLDRPKDDTDRRVPINPDAEAALRQLVAMGNQDGFVLPLPNPKNRDDYTKRTYLERLKQVSAATGIPPKKLTLHNFRRFFVCECADRGVSHGHGDRVARPRRHADGHALLQSQGSVFPGGDEAVQ